MTSPSDGTEEPAIQPEGLVRLEKGLDLLDTAGRGLRTPLPLERAMGELLASIAANFQTMTTTFHGLVTTLAPLLEKQERDSALKQELGRILPDALRDAMQCEHEPKDPGMESERHIPQRHDNP